MFAKEERDREKLSAQEAEREVKKNGNRCTKGEKRGTGKQESEKQQETLKLQFCSDKGRSSTSSAKLKLL